MKNLYLFLIIISLIAISAITYVYAHSSTSTREQQDDAYPTHYSMDEIEEMDEMHHEMMQLIDDPELREAMNQMHESCMRSFQGGRYPAVSGNMMTSTNKLNQGFGGMMGGMMGMM
jgi:hypothetical protein